LNEDEPITTEIPIHCKKWIDYTSKYGLGYILSNGAVGVFFNDATKIIFDQDGKQFHYFERK
jgi:polo-like kinase 1